MSDVLKLAPLPKLPSVCRAPQDSQLNLMREAVWQATSGSYVVIHKIDLRVGSKKRNFTKISDKLYVATASRYPEFTLESGETFKLELHLADLWARVKNNEERYADVCTAAIETCPPVPKTYVFG